MICQYISDVNQDWTHKDKDKDQHHCFQLNTE